jgi:chromosome segregation ATPase
MSADDLTQRAEQWLSTLREPSEADAVTTHLIRDLSAALVQAEQREAELRGRLERAQQLTDMAINNQVSWTKRWVEADEACKRAETEVARLQQQKADWEKAGQVVFAELKAAKQEHSEAMRVLAPNMPESGLVDACRQVKQAAISSADNCEVLEAKLVQAEQEKADILQKDRIKTHEINILTTENRAQSARLASQEATIRQVVEAMRADTSTPKGFLAGQIALQLDEWRDTLATLLPAE